MGVASLAERRHFAEEADLLGKSSRVPLLNLPTEPELQNCPPTARGVRLARESAEMRRRVSQLENRIQELRFSKRRPVSGCETPASERNEIRRLQQLDCVALRLHEELRRRAAEGSNPPSVASSPPRMHSSSLAPSQCGTSYSQLSTKSVLLEQQIDKFCSRFLLRRGNLSKEPIK